MINLQVGEEGAGTVEKVWGGRFTDLRFFTFPRLSGSVLFSILHEF